MRLPPLSLKERLLLLHHCRGAGWKSIHRILTEDSELRHIYDLTATDLIKQFRFHPTHAERFLDDLHHIDIQSRLEQYDKTNIKVITIFDEQYPSLLKQIYDPPWVLYALGDITLLNRHPALGVVGTRQPTQHAYKNMTHVLDPLIEQGWVIVSGLALGIDGYAHRIALNGNTIAVLGSGLYHPYPARHRPLFEHLSKHQLVVSEYPPDQLPNKWQFPERNRIISGLSIGLLVVEAKHKSGSLITADQAMEQGRDVFAIPGPILEANYEGTHGLIQQGAKLVTSAEDILNEFNITAREYKDF